METEEWNIWRDAILFETKSKNNWKLNFKNVSK